MACADIEDLQVDDTAGNFRAQRLLEAHVQRVNQAKDCSDARQSAEAGGRPPSAAASAQGGSGSSPVPGTQRIWVKTWGCSHNSSDSEYMMGQLQEYGYR
jgi:threonylcarbamoyladenosine tRNA methylthiotransferase CDKAL1